MSKNKPITKKELLNLIKDLPEDALISFRAYHYEPSGRRSRIDDDLEINVKLDCAIITISEEEPESFDYDELDSRKKD